MLRIGWASADLTPQRAVQVSGQFHVRVSEGVRDPITATALALSSGDASSGPAGPANAPPATVAVPVDGHITIDGRLDEAAWRRARPITGFRQYQPDEGAPAAWPTEVRILYGPNALYIGARMGQPGGVVAPLARRDQLLDASGDNR